MLADASHRLLKQTCVRVLRRTGFTPRRFGCRSVAVVGSGTARTSLRAAPSAYWISCCRRRCSNFAS